jgi:hypothetical protein
VIRDSTLEVVASQTVRETSWSLRLAPGLYRIEGDDGEGPVCIRHDGRKVVHEV